MKRTIAIGTALAAQLMLATAMAGEPGSLVPSLQGDLDPLASTPTFEALPSGAAGGYTAAYDVDTLAHHATSIPWVTAGVYASTFALGVLDWDWGTASFSFADEGFFGRDTPNLGVDKLGHVYSTYLLSDLFTFAVRRRAANPEWAELSGAILGMGVMTTVEVLDGFSSHGLSWEDLVVDAMGAGFSYLSNTVPGMRDKVDFRIEYLPSGNVDGFRPHSDYTGQKFLLAFKLAGFDGLAETPLRYVEVHAGYFARGFTRDEKLEGEKLRREPYVGIGLNLQELLFGWPSVRDTTAGRIGRHTLQYVQVPYTYVAHPYD